MITLKELSVKCGVSIATISNVINGKENVSEKTRKLVQEAIKETGYKPNFLASSLRSTKTHTLGIIVEDITAFSSPELIDGIMKVAEEKNYRCILENLRLYNKEIFDTGVKYQAAVEKSLNQLLAIKVDGIIYVASHGRNLKIFPENMDIPAVFVYAKSGDEKYPSVLLNDEKAAYDIVKYMISKGWKNIATVTGLTTSVHSLRRQSGYEKALTEAGLSVNPALIKNGDWQKGSAYGFMDELLKAGADSVFCQNDFMASGVFDWLKEKGMVPGKDFGVAGFDGQDFTNFMEPALTTMKIPLRDMGNIAGELIISKINGTDNVQIEVQSECTFIEGTTV